jgi:hypothetical protein
MFLFSTQKSINCSAKIINMNNSTKSLLGKVLLFVIVLVAGVILYFQTSPKVKSYASTGIIAGKYPYHDEMNVNYFTMDINTQNNSIILSMDITYFSEGNYSLLLTLPWRIASFQNLSTGNWIIRNAESGSIVMAILSAENVSEREWSYNTFRVLLNTKDSILDKIFETSILSLPFGGSITLDVQEKLDELRETFPIATSDNVFNGTVRVSVPPSAVITGTTQPINRRDPAKENQVLEFQITQFKPFQLQYVDSAQRAEFEVRLLISGMLLGVAASGFAGIGVEYINAKYQKRNEKKESISPTQKANSKL